MTSYPVYLTHLDERWAVVVGTGPAAERKVRGLLDVNAQVALIAPDPPEQFRVWARGGRIEWVRRSYQRGDLQGAALVIVTEASAETTARIREHAREQNVLINITGNTEHSTFANGSVLRRGPLIISVSTSGAAPSVSVRIREKLSGKFGPEYEELLTIMNALREPMQAHVSDFEERRDRWYAILESEALDLFRAGQRQDALDCIEAIVGPAVMDRAEERL